MSRVLTSSISALAFRSIEDQLSEPLFMGVPLGACLNDSLQIEFVDGWGDWRRRAQWKNRARNLKYWLHPLHGSGNQPRTPSGRILVTWYQATPRYDELLLPTIVELGLGNCAVIHDDPEVAARLPADFPTVGAEALNPVNVAMWRAAYGRCWPDWRQRLRALCREFALPDGSFELLRHHLLIASQRLAGALEFLRLARPSVVLTEYDRNNLWSCLVLAARRLQIPSVTLVHGAIRQDALTFSPVLADRILCWGEIDRQKLLGAGEVVGKVLVAGCPRLTRDLSVSGESVKVKLGLDRNLPIVMYATSTEFHRFEHVRMFCDAIGRLEGVAGLVRLHPSESLSIYDSIASEHRGIRFTLNSEMTVDESLAASDVVVVSASGFGSDALVKRRPVVVLHVDDDLEGQNRDLVQLAGSPHCRTTEELTRVLAAIAHDELYRRHKVAKAEDYVQKFCSYFGHDSAKVIAKHVRELAAGQVSV